MKEEKPSYPCPSCGGVEWKWESEKVTHRFFACGSCGTSPRYSRPTEEMDGKEWVRTLGTRLETAKDALGALQREWAGRELTLMEQFEVRRTEREYREAQQRLELAVHLSSAIEATSEGYLSVYLPELKFGVTLTWGDFLSAKVAKGT